ncbi:MAG: protein kinase [Myxococcota bacterium]
MVAAPPRPPEFLKPAQSLSSRYELLGRLGSGGMAEVYLARAVGLADFEKIVVLKRILPAKRDDARFIEMFRDEARVAATLEHPNIVHTHDIGVRGNECFFTMEYLHGEDLKAILSAANKAREPLPLELALQIVVGCAAGLHHAHEQTDYSGRPLNIVHRDVSPSNVIVTRQSGVKLIDFGIAKAASAKQETGVGVLKGKAAYMSPEQCRGETLDRRSDVFALGIVLYEMIAMQRPFRTDNVLDMVGQIISEAPTPLSECRPDCPPALERIVLKALHKDARHRYRTVFEMQEELELVTRDCRLLALPGALGRYLEHLFGPKPHPWTRKAEPGAPIAKRAWKDLDSQLTRAHEEEHGPSTQKMKVADKLRAASAMVATTPNIPSVGTLPSNPDALRSPGSPRLETTANDSGEPIATDDPSAGRVRSIVAAGLVTLALSAAGLSMWHLGRDQDEAPSTAAGPSRTTPTTDPPAQPPLAAKTPTKTPAEAPPASPATADALLESARHALDSDPAGAYRDAKRAHELRNDPVAAELMGHAACRLGDSEKAHDAVQRLEGPARTTVQRQCLDAGIVLE